MRRLARRLLLVAHLDRPAGGSSVAEQPHLLNPSTLPISTQGTSSGAGSVTSSGTCARSVMINNVESWTGAFLG